MVLSRKLSVAFVKQKLSVSACHFTLYVYNVHLAMCHLDWGYLPLICMRLVLLLVKRGGRVIDVSPFIGSSQFMYP